MSKRASSTTRFSSKTHSVGRTERKVCQIVKCRRHSTPPSNRSIFCYAFSEDASIVQHRNRSKSQRKGRNARTFVDPETLRMPLFFVCAPANKKLSISSVDTTPIGLRSLLTAHTVYADGKALDGCQIDAFSISSKGFLAYSDSMIFSCRCVFSFPSSVARFLR